MPIITLNDIFIKDKIKNDNDTVNLLEYLKLYIDTEIIKMENNMIRIHLGLPYKREIKEFNFKV